MDLFIDKYQYKLNYKLHIELQKIEKKYPQKNPHMQHQQEQQNQFPQPHKPQQIITKRIKGASQCPKSEALYEQVIEHNFQIIGQLLNKLDIVLAKHEEIEIQRVNFGKRLGKIEANIQAIHNQYRRENLCIGTRISDLKEGLTGIQKQHRSLFQDINKNSFKSCKVIDSNYEQIPSQRCMSNRDKSKHSHKLIPNVNLHVNIIENSKNYNEKSKNQKQERKQQCSEESEIKSIKNVVSQTSINRISSFKAIKQVETRLKKVIGKKTHTEQKRKSLDLLTHNSLSWKMVDSGQKLGVINEKTENEKQLSESKSNQNRCNNQVSWNTHANQLFELNYNQDDAKVEMQKKIGQKVEQEKQWNMIFNWICSLIEKIKTNGLADQSIENLFKFHISQDKFSEGLDKGQEYRKFGKQLENKLNQEYEFIRRQLKIFSEKNSSEIFRIKEEIDKIRKILLENTATKSEIREALKIVQKKLNDKLIAFINGNIQQPDGVMISKCLGCNRTLSIGEGSAPKISQTYKQIESVNRKKYSVSELKKKTMEVLRNERSHKPRQLSKTSYILK